MMDASTFTTLADGGLPPPLTPDRGLSMRTLMRVRDYIEAHMGEALTLSTLAGVACLSRFHFARMFRLSTGATPMRYVAKRRLEGAKRLLAGGDSLCDIALALGFCDQSHFTRAFRRATGTTPGSYARRPLKPPFREAS